MYRHDIFTLEEHTYMMSAVDGGGAHKGRLLKFYTAYQTYGKQGGGGSKNQKLLLTSYA